MLCRMTAGLALVLNIVLLSLTLGSISSVYAQALCVVSPLPSSPPTHAAKVIWERDGNRFSVSVWRVGCNAENSNLLMHVAPKDGDAPRICSNVFSVQQNNDTFSDVVSLKVSPDNREFCNNVSTPATFLLAIEGAGLNEEAALKLSYENGLFEDPNKLLNVSAYTPSTGAGKGKQLSAGHSGTWYSPGRNGEGFVFEVVEGPDQPSIVAYYYTYDQRKQMYLLGSKSFAPGATHVTIPMKITSGASFGFAFSPSDVFRKDWGTLKVSFDSCESGTVVYESNLDFDNATIEIIRLTKIKGLACP